MTVEQIYGEYVLGVVKPVIVMGKLRAKIQSHQWQFESPVLEFTVEENAMLDEQSIKEMKEVKA